MQTFKRKVECQYYYQQPSEQRKLPDIKRDTTYSKRVNSRRHYVTVLNVYIPNNRVAKYVNQKLAELKGEFDKSTVIVGDLNTLLSIVDGTIKQKINEDVEELSTTINQPGSNTHL